MLFTVVLAALGLAGYAQAHGTHDHQPTVPADADWATRHMAEEHHISLWDAASFFHLHDYDDSGEWSADEISKTYGLQHPSTNHVSQEEKDRAVKQVIELFDRDSSGTISFAEFTVGDVQGIKLPDLGYGPGHHGDDELEYEIHHFEKYHGPDATLEELTHPEDIEHFKVHEQLEAQQDLQDQMDRMSIVQQNIPRKFLRSP